MSKNVKPPTPEQSRKTKERSARARAAIRTDPVRREKLRKKRLDRYHADRADPIRLVRMQEHSRATTRRLRMINPEYAAQWERDARGRWYRAAQSSDGSITRDVIRDLERELLCPYCAEPLRYESLVFDHIDPIANGGQHSAGNLAACCSTCNREKSDSSLIQFLVRRSIRIAAQ
jgi:5-methylcytosine-specific restriction endonuclease McrA